MASLSLSELVARIEAAEPSPKRDRLLARMGRILGYAEAKFEAHPGWIDAETDLPRTWTRLDGNKTSPLPVAMTLIEESE